VNKWIQVSTQPGRPEILAKLENIPKGPYFLIPQHETDNFKKSPLSFQLKPLEEFETRWGYSTFCIGPDFMPMLCGYHWDTSD